MPVDKETLIASFSKNKDEEVRLSRVEISGRTYVSIAVFMKEGGAFRRGVTLAPALAHEILPVLTKLLEEIG